MTSLPTKPPDDPSELEESEAGQEQVERRLRESEARFRLVLNSMREGVLLYDKEGVIRFCNPGAQSILGVPQSEVNDVDPIKADVRFIHEDGSPLTGNDFLGIQAIRTGQPQPPRLMGMPHSNGEVQWLSVTADPVFLAGESSPSGAVAVFTDVTALREADQRLRQAEKLEALGQMAGGIAHELNNLLTVIIGEAELLRSAPLADADMIEGVNAIDRAAARAEQLVQHLLAVGRKQMLRPTEVVLNRFLRENMAVLCDGLPATILVEFKRVKEPVIATLDRARLTDALRVLIGNAGDAMPSGGTLTFATETVRRVHPHGAPDAQSQAFAMVSVQDSGVGMEVSVQDKLFAPFYSSQPFGSGKGLGLAAVHGIVHQHHGFIEVESTPGVGTTVKLFFPTEFVSNAVGLQ